MMLSKPFMPKDHDAGALCLAAGLATKPSSFSLGMLDTATEQHPVVALAVECG